MHLPFQALALARDQAGQRQRGGRPLDQHRVQRRRRPLAGQDHPAPGLAAGTDRRDQPARGRVEDGARGRIRPPGPGREAVQQRRRILAGRLAYQHGMRPVLQDHRAPGQHRRLADDVGRGGPGHRQVGEHLVQPGGRAQLLALAVDDPRVHGLGDLDEHDLPGKGDEREIVLRRSGDERRGQAAGVPAAEFDRQPAGTHRGELGHVPGLQRGLRGQRDAGRQHQLAAVQKPGRVGHLDRVHPPDRPVQQASAGQHPGGAAAHRIELEDLRQGGQHDNMLSSGASSCHDVGMGPGLRAAD